MPVWINCVILVRFINWLNSDNEQKISKAEQPNLKRLITLINNEHEIFEKYNYSLTDMANSGIPLIYEISELIIDLGYISIAEFLDDKSRFD